MHHNVHGERIDQLYLQPVDAYHTFIGTASYTALRSQAETGSAYHREVQLSEVLAVDEGRAGLVGGAEEGSNFSFALRYNLLYFYLFPFKLLQYLHRTANTDYFVVEAPTQDTDPRESALDPDRLFHWETAIRLALMPPDNADTGTPAGAGQNNHRYSCQLGRGSCHGLGFALLF